MRIKKLELCGFKSFKDRTVIHFDAGITGIVGPNGCGKSNIVDALVWVMGEMSAKHLRGASMADVIFAGAEGYAPMGMAEVNLTLENDGGPFPAKYSKFSEVMITRRLYRSGDSEYLINKEPARLRDIQEVFMDTGAGSKGFSIVEQGAIGKIITAKPEDRRTLIEEAAGITKFKVRKRESQRKLESTDQNLIRLQDIIGEQKRHLDSLQRQAARAERYRSLKKEVQEKDLWLSSRTYLNLHAEEQAASEVFTTAQAEETEAQANLSTQETELQTLKLNVLEREKAVEEWQIKHQDRLSHVQRLEKEIRELQFEIEQARRTEEMTGNIRNQYQARQEALLAEKQKLSSQHGVTDQAAQELKTKYDERKIELDTIQARIRTVDEELTVKRREMLTVSQSESHISAKAAGLEDKLKELDERLENARAVLNDLSTQKDDFEKRRNRLFGQLESERQMQLDIVKDVETYQANLEVLHAQVYEKQGEVERFKEELNKVSSRLYGLEDLQANFEGFEDGVKSVMLWQRSRQVTRADGSVENEVAFQPVAEVVEVPAQYELAMEAALGNRLQLLLSQTPDAALGAVDYLKEQKRGRSGFVAAGWAGNTGDAASARQSLNGQPGVIAWLEDVVQVPEVFTSQVKPFLGGVVIVDTIRTALRLRADYPGLTFVTSDGDTLSVDGVLTGGASDQVESGVLKRRREIKELSQAREEWAGKLALAQASLKKLEAQQKTLSEELETAKRKQNEKELEILAVKKDHERAETELANVVRAHEKQFNDVSRDEGTRLSVHSDLEQLQERLVELRTQKLELDESVTRLTAEYEQARGGVDELNRLVTSLQVESTARIKEAEGLKYQLEMIERSLAEVTDQMSKMSEESLKNNESLSSNQVLIEHRKVEFERTVRESEEAGKMLAEVRDAYEVIAAQAEELEKTVSGRLHRMNELKSRMNESQLKLEQCKMKAQYLVDQMNERYMVNLTEVAQTLAAQEWDQATVEAEVAELKEKLGKIGEVNLSAIQEYDELISRYEFLNRQFTDLTDAKEQLRKVIDRINRICTKRFKETFEQVNERFMKVFPVLFGGGEARLILVEDPEKDELGIDIVSRPPGKKLQNVSLLSGGEKALTAVSLIFSIFLVKPSPFCLLDEVDAPLDDANVFRFNDLVKEMAKRSQIIVVTHNKHTMKVNKKLYGVTMEEKGVSKMVSVSLDQATQVVGG